MELGDFVTPERAVELRLLSGRAHYDLVVQAVQTARTSVWIATANLKELLVQGTRATYHSVLADFDRLARRGVELRMLHAALPSRPFREEFDRHPRLVQGGLELRLCPRVHLKVVIVDGASMYLGSANWTGAGLGAKGENRRNFELGVLTADSQLIDTVQGLYERLWRGAACGTCRLRDRCEAPLDGLASGPAPSIFRRKRRA